MEADPETDQSTPPTTVAATTTTATTIHPPESLAVSVDGNRLVDTNGTPIQLHGATVSGFEYACAQGWGFSDGPVDQDVINAMLAWNINAVRVTINEHCWLDRNGVDPQFAGDNYQTAVLDWVDLLLANDIVVIVSLIWSDAGDTLAMGQAVTANRDHSLDLWASLGAALVDRQGIIIDLYGEPHDISWECWQSGCVTEEGYPAVGMQEMLDAVRTAGALQPVILSGLEYANNLTGWVGWEVVDSMTPEQLIAGWHSYDFNRCIDADCWDAEVAPVAAEVPVITVEFGGSTCDGTYVEELLPWMDANKLSYLAWAWNPWGHCEEGPDLITDPDGTPTGYGEAVRSHYLTR